MAVQIPSSLEKAFSQTPIFAGLDAQDLQALAGHFKHRSFARAESLFHEGHPAQTYYLLLAGQVKILQTSTDGEEVIMHVLGQGELIGALPSLGEGNYPASAQAMSETVIAASIRAEVFESLLLQYPAITRNLLRFASGVIQAAHRRLRELATERVERRIARTLTRLAKQLGTRTETGIVIETPLSRQDLADMCGTTLFTVSRTLKAWERGGLLLAEREKVTILHPHGLVAIGEDLPEASNNL